MYPKIRYRLVFNYANRLNKHGLAPISVECRQGCRKLYLSTNILVKPCQWQCGRVVEHENADKITAYVVKYRNSIEEVETITNALYKLLLISANTNGIWAIILCQQSEYSIVAKGTRWDNFFDVAYGDATLSLTPKDSISSGVWYSIL